MRRMVAACFGVALVGRVLAGQQMTMRMSGGEVLAVGQGQVLIVKAEGRDVIVDGVVADGGTGPRVERGDRIIRFQGGAIASVQELMAAYRAAAVGTPMVLEVRRGAATHEVRFNKPVLAAGTTRAVTGAGNSGAAGAWTSSAGGANAFALLGAELTENGEGLPEVVNRGAHPLASQLALRVGDVVTELNGHPIVALDGLRKWYSEVAVGQQVTLKALRRTETLTFTFTKPGS